MAVDPDVVQHQVWTHEQLEYVNPGSLGCHDRPLARYCTVELRGGCFGVEHHAVPYSDAWLYRAFEERRVPEREFIYRAFFGGRFGGVIRRQGRNIKRRSKRRHRHM